MNREKHFEIDYFIGSHTFTYMCTTAAEAYDALMDIGRVDSATLILSSADDYMQILCNMKNGSLLNHQNHRLRISYVDGEV